MSNASAKNGPYLDLIAKARSGDERAMLLLSDICYNSAGGPKSVIFLHGYRSAFSWATKAAALGNSQAFTRLGLLHSDRKSGFQNKKKAFEAFKDAALRGDLYGQYLVWRCYQLGVGTSIDMHQAFTWYSTSARSGYEDSQFMVGQFLAHGWGGVEKNCTAAVKWWRKASSHCPSAACNLGVAYEAGMGVRKNYDAAYRWFLKGAKKGDVLAAFNLARCVLIGSGTKEILRRPKGNSPK